MMPWLDLKSQAWKPSEKKGNNTYLPLFRNSSLSKLELNYLKIPQLDHFLRFSSFFIFFSFWCVQVHKLISFIFVLTRKLNHFDLMVYKAICCCFWLEKCQVQCYHIYHGISSGEKLMISQLLFFWAASSWTTQVWWSFCFVALRAGCVDVGLRRAAVIWFPWVTVWRPEAGCSGSASRYCDFSAGFQSCS